MTRVHPNLKENYFEVIDNVDNAYWLGFLYADGSITSNGSKYIRVKIHLNNKDECIIDRFITCLGANINSKESFNNTSRIQINSKKLASDLIRCGCIPRKSNIITLPELASRDLYLAFILGYYDGDGTQNTTTITSGSKNFLEQIKSKFHINNKLRQDGINRYRLSLGTTIFNEMMDNYKYSLPRKRKYFCTTEERARRAGEASRDNMGKKKFHITKEELEKLVWEIPATKIAEKFGVSDSLITKRCRQLGIEKPGRGYWARVRSN